MSAQVSQQLVPAAQHDTPIRTLSAGTTREDSGLTGCLRDQHDGKLYTANHGLLGGLTSAITERQFNRVLLHNEGGTPHRSNRQPRFSRRTICAAVNSFSPLALAEQDRFQTLPSIQGRVIDQDGNPLMMSDQLSGDEERLTATAQRWLFQFCQLFRRELLGHAESTGYLFVSLPIYIGINGDKP